MSKLDEALKELRSGLKKYPGDLEILDSARKHGYHLFNEGKASEAKAIFTLALKYVADYPYVPDIRHGLTLAETWITLKEAAQRADWSTACQLLTTYKDLPEDINTDFILQEILEWFYQALNNDDDKGIETVNKFIHEIYPQVQRQSEKKEKLARYYQLSSSWIGKLGSRADCEREKNEDEALKGYEKAVDFANKLLEHTSDVNDKWFKIQEQVDRFEKEITKLKKKQQKRQLQNEARTLENKGDQSFEESRQNYAKAKEKYSQVQDKECVDRVAKKEKTADREGRIEASDITSLKGLIASLENVKGQFNNYITSLGITEDSLTNSLIYLDKRQNTLKKYAAILVFIVIIVFFLSNSALAVLWASQAPLPWVKTTTNTPTLSPTSTFTYTPSPTYVVPSIAFSPTLSPTFTSTPTETIIPTPTPSIIGKLKAQGDYKCVYIRSSPNKMQPNNILDCVQNGSPITIIYKHDIDQTIWYYISSNSKKAPNGFIDASLVIDISNPDNIPMTPYAEETSIPTLTLIITP